MHCIYATNVPPRPWKVRRPWKRGAGGCRMSPTCTCLVTWLMQRCQINGLQNWTPRVSNVCFFDIVKAQRHVK